MIIDRKSLINRWNDSEFTQSVDLALEKILSKSELKTDVDLRGITIGNEGPVKELWHASLAGCFLSNIDFSYSKFEGSFKNAVIENSNFLKSSFDSCRMLSARLIACNFENAKFRTTSMDDSYFEKCNFSSAKFVGKGLMEYGARRAKFIGCDFSKVSFSRLEYRACLFEDCNFTGTMFDKCVLVGVKFFGTAPKAEQLHSCDVRRIMLNGEEVSALAT